MLIDHENKFVYVAVPKTATTTMHAFFNESNRLYTRKHPHLQAQYHYSYRWILDNHPEVATYFSFGFARNPWDRMVSSWIEFTSEPVQLRTWSQALANEFTTFVDFILHFDQSAWTQDIHFQPASWYLGCAAKKVDFMGKYESLDADFKTILSKLGKPLVDISRYYRHRKTKREPDYKPYYTGRDMVEAVGRYFHDDIIHFGYEY